FSMREGPIVSESETRAELFAALQALAEIVPEMRGGQLMAAVGELCADLHGRGLWDATDTELLEAVWQFRRGFEAATVSANRPESGPATAEDGPGDGRFLEFQRRARLCRLVEPAICYQSTGRDVNFRRLAHVALHPEGPISGMPVWTGRRRCPGRTL